MSIPVDLGTPGAENSVRQRLREETGDDNLGPVISEVLHSPATPRSGESTRVTARVSDADGVDTVVASYRTGSASGAFASVVLFDDGAHGDGKSGDGVYAGDMPSFPNATTVVFFVEATDSLGASRRFPVDAPERTLLYRVFTPSTQRLDSYHVMLDSARRSELDSRRIHSNDLLDGAFSFDDTEMHYNIGVRYRGSPWGRPGKGQYRIRFPKDDRFHRGHRDLNLTGRGRSWKEGSAYHLIGRSGGPGRPAAASEYLWIHMRLNGASRGTFGAVQPVSQDYLEKWYGPNADAIALKCIGRQQFDDGGSMVNVEGASLVYRGENPEDYRNYFRQTVKQSRDDWEPFIRLCRVMDADHNPSVEQLDAEVETVLDLDRFFRVLSARILISDGDALFINLSQNAYLIHDYNTGLWSYVPHDMDFTFLVRGSPGPPFYSGGSPTAPELFPPPDPDVRRLMSRPKPRRIHLRTLHDYVNGYWQPSRANPWFDSVAAQTGIGTSEVKSHVAAVRTYVLNSIRAFTEADFRLLTNSGNDLTIDEEFVVLEGEAAVQVATITYQRNFEAPQTLEGATWTTATRWQAEFPLLDRETEFRFVGFDSDGNLLALADITVTSTVIDDTPVEFRRGDVNADTLVDVSDAISALLYLFAGGVVVPSCERTADADADGDVQLNDAVYLLNYLFRQGDPPESPFTDCGLESTPDGLRCNGYDPCE